TRLDGRGREGRGPGGRALQELLRRLELALPQHPHAGPRDHRGEVPEDGTHQRGPAPLRQDQGQVGDVREVAAPAAALRARFDTGGHREEPATPAPRVAHACRAPRPRRDARVPRPALPLLGDALDDPTATAAGGRAYRRSLEGSKQSEVGGSNNGYE